LTEIVPSYRKQQSFEVVSLVRIGGRSHTPGDWLGDDTAFLWLPTAFGRFDAIARFAHDVPLSGD
jgi:hypothetical protein